MLEPGVSATKSQKLIMYVLSLIIVGLVFHFVYESINQNDLHEQNQKILGKIEKLEK